MQIINYLVLSSIIFSIGLLGIFINRKNMITILMSIELMLLGVNINFVGFSNYLNDLSGQIFAMFILVVAAAEAAVGLAILTVFFKNKGTISVDKINQMKG
ncbi:MAG: NADH-quinone oxidoreductase subunit NuoK [Rickettsiales bacterium]|nr:NADH-quinone oxidoreductase subunit NuoK [Rickettsiales bacterium]|tara:strand:- start:274 stop:576 length:303 start_codon:yes stop_codon:yes gene_type:complete